MSSAITYLMPSLPNPYYFPLPQHNLFTKIAKLQKINPEWIWLTRHNWQNKAEYRILQYKMNTPKWLQISAKYLAT